MTQAAAGHLAEAEALLPATTLSGDERSQRACRGHILANLARMLAVSGRMPEAERLAEQSVRILENVYPANDWTFLRPLQILATVRLESGETARARELVRRIQSIRIKSPEDGAIVHVTAGALLQIEGLLSEAEAEYHDAFLALEQAGRGGSADAAAILHCLASLYLKEERLDEARQALSLAHTIQDRANDVVPMDRIKLLALRGVLHGRAGEWQQAEEDFCDALSILDRQPSENPPLLRTLLESYSFVLRRTSIGERRDPSKRGKRLFLRTGLRPPWMFRSCSPGKVPRRSDRCAG